MGKKAEKEAEAERAAAKKAEKDAKKAAAAARREARKESKAARAAEEGGDGFEEANAGGWTEEEQALLNAALAEFPASMEKKERWKAIATAVGTRGMKVVGVISIVRLWVCRCAPYEQSTSALLLAGGEGIRGRLAPCWLMPLWPLAHSLTHAASLSISGASLPPPLLALPPPRPGLRHAVQGSEGEPDGAQGGRGGGAPRRCRGGGRKGRGAPQSNTHKEHTELTSKPSLSAHMHGAASLTVPRAALQCR